MTSSFSAKQWACFLLPCNILPYTCCLLYANHILHIQLYYCMKHTWQITCLLSSSSLYMEKEKHCHGICISGERRWKRLSSLGRKGCGGASLCIYVCSVYCVCDMYVDVWPSSHVHCLPSCTCTYFYLLCACSLTWQQHVSQCDYGMCKHAPSCSCQNSI